MFLFSSEEKVLNGLLKGLDCGDHIALILKSIFKQDNGHSHQSLLATIESLYPSQFDKTLAQILSVRISEFMFVFLLCFMFFFYSSCLFLFSCFCFFVGKERCIESCE